MTTSEAQLRLPPRPGRTVAVLALSVTATALLVWALTQPQSGLDASKFYVGIFPILAIASAYRLWRPRVPLTADEEGLRIDTGLPFLGMRASIAWADVARIRINARDLLLVELTNSDRWVADKPWRVRANVRANRRKFKADAVVALNELVRPPEGVADTLKRLGRVKVDTV